MSFDFGKYRALKKKREERDAIQKAGGGHNIAKALMPDDTDFEFGHNTPVQESVDRCMGRVVCQSCKKFHGYCVEVDEDKEKLKMLPTGNEEQSSGRTKRQGSMEWIKNEDLSTTPKEAKILMVRLNKNGRYGARVELKLAFEGAIKFWGVPPNKDNANYSLLLNKFGPDENEWVDKRIHLFLEKDKFSDQYFPRVEFPSEGKSRR